MRVPTGAAETYGEQIRRKIRRPISADPGMGTYKGVPEKTGKIAAVHGTVVQSVIELAIHGRFVRPRKELRGEFYVTANPEFEGPDGEKFRKELERPGYQEYDLFEQAVRYADQQSEENEFTIKPSEAVVIAFNNRALEYGYDMHQDNIDGALELVLPAAPTFKSIRAIYPVETEASGLLHRQLSQLSAQ